MADTFPDTPCRSRKRIGVKGSTLRKLFLAEMLSFQGTVAGCFGFVFAGVSESCWAVPLEKHFLVLQGLQGYPKETMSHSVAEKECKRTSSMNSTR